MMTSLMVFRTIVGGTAVEPTRRDGWRGIHFATVESLGLPVDIVEQGLHRKQFNLGRDAVDLM